MGHYFETREKVTDTVLEKYSDMRKMMVGGGRGKEWLYKMKTV
jgi:hypothetical protein